MISVTPPPPYDQKINGMIPRTGIALHNTKFNSHKNISAKTSKRKPNSANCLPRTTATNSPEDNPRPQPTKTTHGRIFLAAHAHYI